MSAFKAVASRAAVRSLSRTASLTTRVSWISAAGDSPARAGRCRRGPRQSSGSQRRDCGDHDRLWCACVPRLTRPAWSIDGRQDMTKVPRAPRAPAAGPGARPGRGKSNLSGHACTLSGHPGVSAVSLTGRQIGSPAGWDSTPRHLVRLANGATATATLQVGDPGNWYQCFLPGSLGRPGKPGLLPTAAGLRVYPPNQFASKVIPYPLTGCAHAGPVNMHAGPVTPGVPAE